ncbi:MAG: indolepyruvate ferredoxin oxidoreductase family protein [Solirubrobacteraceae bacterium]|nr:indolepyruvate ferredoxin oxidoreductase family protein [Solirubrobacteraceae bacterium]
MYRDVNLQDKFAATAGAVLLSGVQSLVRTTLDQRRLDRAAGLSTAAYVSGYQGSPLGGVEREMGRAAAEREDLGVVFAQGVNEELAATAVAGTQLLGEVGGRRHDAVTGYWFGKAPGLDRAADAIRHANVSGTHPLGGAVAWIGDDPSAKSSSVPSSSEPLCRSLHLPVLAPGTVQEVLDFGLHAVALSRHAGTWAALKVVADIADATSTVEVGGVTIPELDPRTDFTPATMLPPTNLVAEHDLMVERLARATAYARAADLNRIVFEPRRPRVAVVAAGVGFQSVLRAIDDLQLDTDALGLRLVRLGMPWPLDRDELRRLLAGVEAVLVVEDKLPFVETLVKEALYRTADAPLVLGKEDAGGRELLSPRSTLSADDVARALGRILPSDELGEETRARLALLDRAAAAAPGVAPLAQRTPYFCSGCPHSTSTRAEPDQLVGVGIGCHIMVVLDTDGRRGQLLGMPQMGGEGAQWLGLMPFTDDEHFIQNIGDGTFFHSGSLAIRAAIAAGATMTFRLLHNDVVAMTGGQTPAGQMDIPALTRWLEVEGVRRTIITTPEPDGYRGVSLAANASVRSRDDLADVQRELTALGGVTVLLHDDQCATEKRRLRKRGKLAAPKERVVINERVCEGCGDCGDTSSCLSVQPVETEFGRKTKIHQSSCNQDFSCTDGDCPSFLMVTPAEGAHRAEPPLPPAVPAPTVRVGSDVTIRMPGVGGTGVVTLSQILEMAAHIEGRHTAGVEQIGLAQKGGPVLSDLRISVAPITGQLRATAASVDVLLGLDALGAAAPATLAVCDPSRTVAVVNTADVPTAAMVTDARVPFSHADRAVRRVRGATRELHTLDAPALSERLFDDHMPANMILVGAAFQHGLLPLSELAIERAIALNGAAVEISLAAFRWGRAVAADPAAVTAALAPPPPPEPAPLPPVLRDQLDSRAVTGELRRLLDIRLAELVDYQDLKLAEDYLRDVLRVLATERLRTPGSTLVTEAYARGLFKLLAAKDEYEVARLHAASVPTDAERVEILLHPPVLRALGMRRKLHLNGRWAFPMLRLLARGKRLRGTRLDPFGRAEVRRVERALPSEYRDLVDAALAQLRFDTAPWVTEIAELPDLIRGYEDIKLRNVELFRERAAALLAAPPAAPSIAIVRSTPAAGTVEPGWTRSTPAPRA